MNRTEITFKNEVITLVFGTWVMGQLIKSGYSLETLQEEMKNNPFDFFPLLVYLAAVNGLPSKDREAYNQNNFYDWVDSVGGIASQEVNNVIKCFTNSLGADVPKKDQTAVKVRPSKT